MNKKLDIRKNANVLFAINVIIFISLIFFKVFYTKLSYNSLIINVSLIINIVLFITGMVFNVLFIKDADKYDKPVILKIIIIVLGIYLLFNILGIPFFGKLISGDYTKINNKLSSYCETYGCDKYETIAKENYEEFIIKKSYFDYNNVENNLEIVTKYDTKKVISVTATIYSQNEMFSETLINEQVKNYFINFGYNTKEEKIREAFDKRFESEAKDGKAIYKVLEMYNDNNELYMIKTVITLNLK